MAKKKKKAAKKSAKKDQPKAAWGSSQTESKIPEKARRGKRGKKDPKDWKPEFLAAFRVSGMVEESINASGIGRTTFFQMRRRNKDFAAEVREIQLAHRFALGSKLADAAMKRALEGERKVATEFDENGNKVKETVTVSFSPMRERFMLEKYLPNVFGPMAGLTSDDESEDEAEKIRLAWAAMLGSVAGPQQADEAD